MNFEPNTDKKEVDVLTVDQIRHAVKILKSHKAKDQQSNLSPEQSKKLARAFNLFMEKSYEDSPLEDDMDELKNMIQGGL